MNAELAVVDHRVAVVHIDVVAVVIRSLKDLSVLLMFFDVVKNFSDRSCRSAADFEGNHLLNCCSALNAFLHDRSAMIAGNHVAAWFEENRRFAIGADETFVDLQMKSIKNIVEVK